MNYLLYGEDTYRSRAKLREIVAGYREKYGRTTNVRRIDASEVDGAAVRVCLETGSLFQTGTPLMVVERALSVSDADLFVNVLNRLKGVPTAIAILWHGSVERGEERLLDAIKEAVDKVQEYGLLRGQQLSDWIAKEAQVRGVRLTPSLRFRLSVFGGDTWRVAQEIEKEALGSVSVLERNAAGANRTVFEFGEAVFGNPERSLNVLFALIWQGEDPMRLFGYLAAHVRTVALVKECREAKRPVPKAWGIHPYAEKKAAVAGREVSMEFLRNFFLALYEEDLLIKTGRATAKESLMRLCLLARDAYAEKML